jgi:hypothetical protein
MDINSLVKQFQASGGLPSIPEIKGDADFKLASDSISFLNKYLNTAEKNRKLEVAPLVEEKKNIDGRYKSFTAPLEKVVVASIPRKKKAL